jgi:hypothetical protein
VQSLARGHLINDCQVLKAQRYLAKQQGSNFVTTEIPSNDSENRPEGSQDSLNLETIFSTISTNNTKDLLIDSGATAHMVHDKSLFTEFTAEKHTGSVMGANGSKLDIEGYGTVKIKLGCSDGSMVTITISDVLYVPKIRRNLLAFSVLEDKGARIDLQSRKFQTRNRKVYFPI